VKTPTPTQTLTFALCVGAAAVLAPLWAPLLLAAWCADLLAAPAQRVGRALGGRHRAAAALVVVFVVSALVPVAGVIAGLVFGVRHLLAQMRNALEGNGSLGAVILGGSGEAEPLGLRDWANLASRYGQSAWTAVGVVARASAGVAVATLVFVAALYAFLAEAEGVDRWLRTNLPIPPEAYARLANAFRETGRGLFVAGGGTALLQGAVATIAYMAVGIPSALVLGPLTAVCAIVPVVGSGLVWFPLALELGATGQYGRAGIVVAIGAGLISLVDNFARPLLARYGRLTLPPVVVLVSMVGGVAALGAAGALLGPLVVRLCVEALALSAEARSLRSGPPAEPVNHGPHRPAADDPGA
jgi:predicted PurR-regulated permease PerM